MAEDPFGLGVPPMAMVYTSIKSVEEIKMDHALLYVYKYNIMLYSMYAWHYLMPSA